LSANVLRQIVYSAGRIFTYACLGAAAGYVGLRVEQSVSSMVNVSAVLATIAGVVLVYQGLRAAGVWRRKGVLPGTGNCLAGTLFGSFLNATGLSNAFFAGLLTGFLPCGLLYGMLALSASSASLWWGTAIMIVFGIGTVPVMVMTGLSGSLLSLAARRHVYRAAAWCVVVTGMITVARGFGHLHILPWFTATGCPMCGS
jgi:sulfite exporter TauE/SafE